MFRIEHNVETGEIKEIALNAKEIAAIEKDISERLAADAKIQAEIELAETTKANAKTELLAKLGITADEAKLLLS